MIFFRRAALALLVVLPILVLPAAASALSYEVTTTADEADKTAGAPCETNAGGCSLRAAIEVANGTTGVADQIVFKASVFNGELADTINLATPLPAITDQLQIRGDSNGQCTTEALVAGPCAGVSGPTGNFGLIVEGDNVWIEGLAITGALTGINVINESQEFVAKDNWIGVDLKAEAKANNTGIFIDPGSDDAEIGGNATTARNVIAGNNLEGLDIEGASGAIVRGNFFGVAPDGTTQMGNAKNIEVTDSTAGLGFEAKNNEIGQQLTAEAGATSTCDGGCNLISGAISYGVDLAGNGGNEAPASGPTLVAGNHIGLGVTGMTAIPNAQRGVLVGDADEASIGGSSSGYGNHINGGFIGVLAGASADDLVVDSNQIGLNGAGDPLSPPSEGVNVSSEGISGLNHETEIQGNAIVGTGVGITQHSVGAFIEENEIVDPGIGIYTYGFVGAHGNLIANNAIVSASQQGMLLENDDNFVIGNEVLESGSAGIRVQPFLTIGVSANQIGGDSKSEENLIVQSGGPAIEIEDFETENNEVGRNVGSENNGPFIDLISTEPGTEPNGPNEGIKPPAIGSAKQSSASGSGAQPGATVRVFRKANAEAGELEAFLAETVVDGSGNWSAAFSSAIPAGTLVTATQTNTSGGTSELATPVAAAAENSGGSGGGGNGGGNGGNGGNPKDKTPPDTKILKGPPKKTHKRTVKFKFASTEAGSTFQCKLDRKPFKPCASPKKYKKLKPGKHVFKVRAIDKAGNVDPTPAKRSFKVLK
ncbi:MAG TPA: CSLREA domain-containing protein [Solirubrobacterales bacterium]|jgi:CSLREA domain-containing protein|nr:CSLREA domain-containing protein [Solirubrobacterales bacterium]